MCGDHQQENEGCHPSPGVQNRPGPVPVASPSLVLGSLPPPPRVSQPRLSCLLPDPLRHWVCRAPPVLPRALRSCCFQPHLTRGLENLHWEETAQFHAAPHPPSSPVLLNRHLL